eukprot:CAMPEP_0184503410 /NCGR_PEP_ID=MMETSP0113_2-20130426/51876_1 /TAXON_ID=91329 /ORGANISM="Norrisiella sphaerica, Strain BC52" /LENGTH=698 /DNA_ID=CAMNT_0026892903 /DNA_START=795 /DNA_END=2891 /DNA_ORIENTATION=-
MSRIQGLAQRMGNLGVSTQSLVDTEGLPIPESIKDWTSQDVAIFIKALGKSQCWSEYANKLMKVDVDGATLMDADLDILMELGFHKIHANKVIRQLRKRAESYDDARTVGTTGSLHQLNTLSKDVEVGFPTSLPLTEVEVKRMQLFGDHHELMNTCEEKLVAAMQKLREQRDHELERSKKIFDLMNSKIVNERLRCREEVTMRHEQMNQVLTDALDQIKENQEEAKKEAKVLYKCMQISDWSRRNERMKTIIQVTRGVLEKVQPMLVQVPTLSIEYNENFTQATEDDLFDILQDDPVFEMQATLMAEEERKRLEQQKFLRAAQEEERQRDEEARRVEEARHAEEVLRQKEIEESKRREQIEKERREFLMEKKMREDTKRDEKYPTEQLQRWTALPPMRTKRRYLGVAVSPDGTKLFAVGGYHGSKYLKSVEVYDFHHRLWTNLPPMTERRCGLGVAMSPDGRRMYAIGGYNGPKHSNYLKSVEVFDFRTMKWKSLPPMSTPRAHLAVVVSPGGKRVYALGGNYMQRLSTVEVLDTETNAWSEVPPMMMRRSGLGAAISPDGRHLYAVGGFGGMPLDSVEVLDLAMKNSWGKTTSSKCAPCFSIGPKEKIQWRPLPAMTQTRRYLGCAISPDGRKLYAVGGDDQNCSVEYYDNPSRSWVPLPPMKTKRKGLGAALSPDGRRLYVVGGANSGDSVEWLRV